LSEGEAAQLSAPSEEARHVLLTDNSIPHELPAVIAWTGRQGSSETWHVGVSLHRLSPAAEVSLNEVLASRLISPPQVGQGVDGDKLRTALTFLQARHGGSFALSHDRFTDHLREDSPILIIAPGYAQTRVDYLGLASAFGTNGFRILRFDSTHGLGLGNGNPRSATLGALKDDLDTVVDFAQEHWPGAPLAVLASDLSARVVLKLFGQQRTADLLLLIDPVLDLQAALRAFHHRDIVEARTTGSEFGLIDLLGLPLDADAFLDDAGVGRYADFASVVDDIGRLRCRVALITTPPAQRTYGFAKVVDHSLIQRVTDMLSGRVTSLSLASPVTGQELSSEMQREACFSLVMQCKALLSLHQGAFDLAHEPDSVGISTQFRQEIEQLRIKHHMTRPARAQLWTQYSQHSGVLNEIPSYVQHSNDLYQTVHLFRSHRDILDVGCSHYGFARLWWVNRTYAAPSHPFVDTSDQRYVGIDVHWDSVRSAHEAFTALRRQRSTFSPGIPSTAPPVPFQWIVGDASCLPLGSNLFDHVVCHFTLNFSSNPAVTLRELYRLLRPNGTLTVSSFTPSTDLAAVYRGHLHETRQDGLSGVHRDVLRDLAHLNESIRCRRLHSFTKQSLAALFEHVTTGPVRTFPSLAGHVLITTVQKPDSAR
ncbi:MAG TPA: methyltransferase domain-containing protein, partial [Nitrospiraceae bacterium]|nr:methyltransferase domain-containing protein [Nitrospiraceae bacterium]